VSFTVTGWQGATYGLRMSAGDRDKNFERSWLSVTLALDGGPVVTVPVSPSFWRDCTELRSSRIGDWMAAQGLVPWPRGRPPRFTMEQVSPGHFAVHCPTSAL
jgi:hypothetical protein